MERERERDGRKREREREREIALAMGQSPRAPKQRKAAFWNRIWLRVRPGPQNIKKLPSGVNFGHGSAQGLRNREKQPSAIEFDHESAQAPKHRKAAFWSPFKPWV